MKRGNLEFAAWRAEHFLWIGLLVGTYLLNPFGLRDFTSEKSREFLLKFTAPFYELSGRDDYVVVLFTDDSLTVLNRRLAETHPDAAPLSWPLPLAKQAAALRRLLHFQPSAVFIDLLYPYHGKRPGQKLYVNAVKRFTARGGEFFVARSMPSCSESKEGRRTECVSVSADSLPARLEAVKAQSLPVSWEGYGSDYPLRVKEASDELADTPALALYRAHCRHHGLDCGWLSRNEAVDAPLMTRWGLFIDPIMR